MDIKVWDDKYIIRSDKRQYKLFEIKQRITDEEDNLEATEQNDDGTYAVNVGYFPTLKYLFTAIAEREGRSNRCTTMEGYIKHLEKINKQLEKTLEQMQAVIGTEESLERIINKMGDKLPEHIANIGEEEKPKSKRGRKKKGE